jgi:subtilisin family serine protease
MTITLGAAGPQAIANSMLRMPSSVDDLLDLVRLTPLMERARGNPEVTVGLIDGPVALTHPDLAGATIREVPGRLVGACARAGSAACQHGTFVAGILVAKRGSPAPAICPGCTLLVRAIFAEAAAWNGEMPSATPEDLAAAILDCLEAGARVLNLSVALAEPTMKGERVLQEALDWAARQRVPVVAASGNQGIVGSSVITRHPGVIPVVACDSRGRPTSQSNLGRSIGRQGLRAPGQDVRSLGAAGDPVAFGGTSAATPFVTGTIALLWSEFPAAAPAEITIAVTGGTQAPRRQAVVPPLLDAWASYQLLRAAWRRS